MIAWLNKQSEERKCRIIYCMLANKQHANKKIQIQLKKFWS